MANAVIEGKQGEVIQPVVEEQEDVAEKENNEESPSMEEVVAEETETVKE